MDTLHEMRQPESDDAGSNAPRILDFDARSRPKTKPEHRVSHGLFKWNIENFSDFPRREDKHCISPIFILKETSWFVALHPRARSFGVNKIALNLIRNASDAGPRSVSVSYRIGLESAENKVWFKAEEGRSFGKGDSYGFETSVLGHLEDFMADGVKDENDTVSVLCEIYVLYVVNATSNDEEILVDLNLPRDLLNALKNRQNADVLIEIPNCRYRAHKSVLCARSKTLARMLEDGKSFLQFTCTRSCMMCALYYMYSGSFTFLANNATFSIGLYEFAWELSLTKLIDILVPKSIERKSRILVDRCKLQCTLTEFQLSDISEKIREPEDYTDQKTNICVTFYLKKLDDDCVGCYIGLSGLDETFDFNFKLFLANKTREPCEYIPASFLQELDMKFRYSVFFFRATFRVDDIQRCSSDGNLSLILKFERYFLRHSPQAFASANRIDTDLQALFYDSNDWLEELSSDLHGLLQSGKLSDIKLSSLGILFPVHRSILAARSRYFRRTLHYCGSKNEVKKIVNAVPLILRLMLQYMYTGTLGDTNDLVNKDFLELYEAAETYEIKPLVQECEEFLANFLDREFVYEILVVAKKYNNKYLKSVCTNYIARLSTDSDDSTKEWTNDGKSDKGKE